MAGTVLGIAAWAGVLGPEFKPLTQPASVLAVRAADVLARTGSFGTLPKYSEEGFAQSTLYFRHLRKTRKAAVADPGSDPRSRPTEGRRTGPSC